MRTPLQFLRLRRWYRLGRCAMCNRFRLYINRSTGRCDACLVTIVPPKPPRFR